MQNNNVRPITDRQKDFLQRKGYQGNIDDLTMDEASTIIQGFMAEEARKAVGESPEPSEIFANNQGYESKPQPAPKQVVKQEAKQELTTVQKNAYTITTTLGQEITLSKSVVDNYICKGLTEEEFHYFFNVCKSYKLNPFLKDIYALKYGNEAATFIIDYKVLQQAADNEPTFDGLETGLLLVTASGEKIERQGAYILPNEKLIAAWCIVYRKDRTHHNKYWALYSENVKTKKDGTPNTNWATKPVFMLTKVAKAQALRETYPNWFANDVYVKEEYDGLESKEYQESTIDGVSKKQANSGKIIPDIDIKADELE